MAKTSSEIKIRWAKVDGMQMVSWEDIQTVFLETRKALAINGEERAEQVFIILEDELKEALLKATKIK